MLTKVFKQAVTILEAIEAKGYEAYFVGGSVRDFLAQREIKDIDIASSAPPEMIQQIFKKVIPVGIDHGTVIVRHHDVSYEVTTFRHEGTYSDQRHPDVVTFKKTIQEDLKRRDFTINAIAMDMHGKIIDLYGGRQDLHAKLIRSVGKAHERFMEDPLRIIRALRFSSQLGFAIEKETLREMRALNKEVETVAVERITAEFIKLFQGDFVQNGIFYMMETKVDKYVPIFNKHPHLIHKIPKNISAFRSFGEVIAFFHHIDNEITIEHWVKAWKCSNNIKNQAMNLTSALCQYEKAGMDSWLIYQLEESSFGSFIHLIKILFQVDVKLEKLYEWKEQLQIQSKNDLAINGHELLKLFPKNKGGPWMSSMIANIEKEIVYRRIENTNTAIKEWIRCHPPEIN